eukprot:1535064-Prymnesium_polylepis.2
MLRRCGLVRVISVTSTLSSSTRAVLPFCRSVCRECSQFPGSRRRRWPSGRRWKSWRERPSMPMTPPARPARWPPPAPARRRRRRPTASRARRMPVRGKARSNACGWVGTARGWRARCVLGRCRALLPVILQEVAEAAPGQLRDSWRLALHAGAAGSSTATPVHINTGDDDDDDEEEDDEGGSEGEEEDEEDWGGGRGGGCLTTRMRTGSRRWRRTARA